MGNPVLLHQSLCTCRPALCADSGAACASRLTQQRWECWTLGEEGNVFTPCPKGVSVFAAGRRSDPVHAGGGCRTRHDWLQRTPGTMRIQGPFAFTVSVVEATEKRFSVACPARSLRGAIFNRFNRSSRPSPFLVRHRSDPVRVGGAQGAAASLGCGARSAPNARTRARAAPQCGASLSLRPGGTRALPPRIQTAAMRAQDVWARRLPRQKRKSRCLALLFWPAPSRLLRRPSPCLREAGGPGSRRGKGDAPPGAARRAVGGARAGVNLKALNSSLYGLTADAESICLHVPLRCPRRSSRKSQKKKKTTAGSSARAPRPAGGERGRPAGGPPAARSEARGRA